MIRLFFTLRWCLRLDVIFFLYEENIGNNMHKLATGTYADKRGFFRGSLEVGGFHFFKGTHSKRETLFLGFYSDSLKVPADKESFRVHKWNKT